jgi:hypothetical protein
MSLEVKNTEKTELQVKTSLTEIELSLRWGNSPKTLQAWRQAGKPPRFLKIGRSIRYPLPEILAFEHDALKTSTTKG